MSINGELSDVFPLRRSIRQGCPIDPLLYAICSDSLGWLVQDAMHKGHIKGIQIPGCDKDLVLQQFADDTNSLMANDSNSIAHFWTCLNTFCLASDSIINHAKTGYKLSCGQAPQIILDAGCQSIPDGQIFRLLGIPMGFNQMASLSNLPLF